MLKLLLGLAAWPLHWSIDGRSGTAALWRIMATFHGLVFAGIFLSAVSGFALFIMVGVFWQLIFLWFLMSQVRPVLAAVPA